LDSQGIEHQSGGRNGVELDSFLSNWLGHQSSIPLREASPSAKGGPGNESQADPLDLATQRWPSTTKGRMGLDYRRQTLTARAFAAIKITHFRLLHIGSRGLPILGTGSQD
jgi:hypothetical protein